MASTALSAGSGPDALVLEISQDAYQGDAQYTVSVDGTRIGGTFTASALKSSGQSDTLTLGGDWGPGEHKVEVEFLNDKWDGTAATDRNLYVGGAAYDGQAVPGAAAALMSAGKAGFSFTEAAAPTAPGPASLSAGSGPDALVLKVSQDAYQGSAEYTVSVDGAQIGGTFTASAPRSAGRSDTLTLNGDWGPGEHRVEVRFLNDKWDGTAATDRNLYVDGAAYNGGAIEGASTALLSAGAKGFAFTETNGGAGTGASTGAAAGPNGDLDTLSVYLSGDSWQGNPKATLAVNGVAVGGTLEVSAAHAKDDAQAFTVTGDFGDTPTVAVSFINDGSAGTPDADRNLFLEGFAYDGTEHRGLKETLGYNRTMEFDLSTAPAGRASDFVDSLGVCVHLDYWNTAYGLPGGTGPDMQRITSALQHLGVEHLRVGVPTTDTLPAMEALAADGLKFNVLMPSTSSDALLKAQLDAIKPVLGAVVAIEGPNETNLTGDFGWNGQTGDAAARAYQQALHDAVRADHDFDGIDVRALTLAGVGTDYYGAFGDMSAGADAGNMHVYFVDSLPPASTVRYALGLASMVTPGLPTVFTETNYTSAPQIRGSVTESVQAKYVLDLLMDTAQAGVEATYLYELLDEQPDPGQANNEDHYGLFRADGTAKPAAGAVHNLTAILADGGAEASTFGAGTLPYSLSGLPGSGNSMLLAKSTGAFDVVVWAEPELWDVDTQTEVPASHRSVTLSFASPQADVAVFDPLVGTEPVATYQDASSVVLDITDHPLVVEVGGSVWA